MTLDEFDLGVLLDERTVQGKRDVGVDEHLAALQTRALEEGGDELCRRHALVVDLPDVLVLGARAHRRRVAHVGVQGTRVPRHDRDMGLFGVKDPLEAGEPHEVGRRAGDDGVEATLFHERAQALDAFCNFHCARCSNTKSTARR